MDEQLYSSSPTSEERLLAGLSHVSFLFFGFGPMVSGLIWSLQRRKSKYIAYHALQALGYQVLFPLLSQVVILVGSIFLLLAMVIFATVQSSAGEGTAGIGMVVTMVGYGVFFGLILIWALAYCVFGLVATVFCLMGKPFQYPWLGKKLADYLLKDLTAEDIWFNETNEDRYVAAMSHFSFFIQYIGILVPLTVLLSQKVQTFWSKIQSWQALLYQGIGVIGYFIFGMIAYAVMIPLTFLIPVLEQDPSGKYSFIMIVLFGLMLLLAIAMVLIVPLYSLFSFIAGIQVLKGRDYNYPILGKLVRRYFERRQTKSDQQNGGSHGESNLSIETNI